MKLFDLNKNIQRKENAGIFVSKDGPMKNAWKM